MLQTQTAGFRGLVLDCLVGVETKEPVEDQAVPGERADVGGERLEGEEWLDVDVEGAGGARVHEVGEEDGLLGVSEGGDRISCDLTVLVAGLKKA